MNILFISPYERPLTGGNKRYERLVFHMLRKSLGSRWLVPETRNLGVFGCQVIPIPIFYRFGYTFGFFLGCLIGRKRIKNKCQGVDLIHVFGETPVLAAVYLSLLLGVPLSIGVRSDNKKILHINLADKQKIQRAFLRLRSWLRFLPITIAYKRCKAIVVQSDFAKTKFCAEYKVPDDKVIVVPNDLPLWASEFSRDRLNRVYKKLPKSILFVGTDTRLKGFDIFLRALCDLKCYAPRINKVYIVGIVGDGISAPPEIPGVDVNFLGRIDGIADIMYSCDLLVVPSRDDQFPNVVLEAFATGLPVIGSRVSGISYLINDQSLLFDSNSSSSLLECLNYVHSEVGYSRAISFVKERVRYFDFPWEKVYVEKLYEKVMEKF